MPRRFTLKELIAALLSLTILAAIALPAIVHSRRESRLAACQNALATLYKMSCGYMVKAGGSTRSLPDATGGAFWLRLSQIEPPLIDPNAPAFYFCPVRAATPVSGQTDYRGPSGNANAYADSEPLGADQMDNHGAGRGGSVLLKSGDVRRVEAADPLWSAAERTTKP
jgi:type II secretory pathway pseudopilin PulG